MIAVYLDPATNKYSLQVGFALEYLLNMSGFSWKYLEEKTELSPNDVILYYSPFMPDPKSVALMNQMCLFIYIPFVKEFYIPGFYSGENLRYNIRTYENAVDIPYICNKRVQGHPIKKIDQDGFKYSIYEFDVIGNIFFHLVDDDRNHLRNKDKNQNLYLNELCFDEYFGVPYINYYIDGFFQTVKDLLEFKRQWQIRRCLWPANQPFAAIISHNLDSLQKWSILSILLFLVFGTFIHLIKLRLGVLFKNLWSIIKLLFTNKEDYWNFYNIQHIERKHKYLSTWFIGVNKAHRKEKFYDYEFEDADVIKELQDIIKSGGEIALLDNNTSKALNDIKVEYDYLVNKTKYRKTGIRHKDYFGEMEHLDAIHQEYSIRYDSSRTLPDRNAFYNGFATPYPIYIKGKHSASHLVYELPVNFNDNLLMVKKYKHISFSDAMYNVKSTLNTVKRIKGLFHISFTNSLFYEIKYMPRLLEYIVDDLKNQNAYVATATDMVDWIEKRNKVEILEDENNRIVLHFFDNIDQITFEILGLKRVIEVSGGITSFKGNIIFLEGVTKGLKVEIKMIDEEPPPE